MSRDASLDHLHPIFREKSKAVLESLAEESLPFRIFEGFRSPERQRYLYAQGRTRAGAIVTRAKAWQSYHQYGVAADFVLFENGRWSWDDRGKRRKWWQQLHQVARDHGLEPLSWELPHLQLQKMKLADLQAGRYPKDGDMAWAEHLEDAILNWQDPGSAPPLPPILAERPPLPEEAIPVFYQVTARSGLRLRGGPGTGFSVVGSLLPGQQVRVLDWQQEWAQIDLAGDGLADGFCHGGFLAEV